MSITRPWFSRKIISVTTEWTLKRTKHYFFNKVKIDYKEEREARIYRLHQNRTFLEMELRKFQ